MIWEICNICEKEFNIELDDFYLDVIHGFVVCENCLIKIGWESLEDFESSCINMGINLGENYEL